MRSTEEEWTEQVRSRFLLLSGDIDKQRTFYSLSTEKRYNKIRRSGLLYRLGGEQNLICCLLMLLPTLATY
jgi:hypothetical protein